MKIISKDFAYEGRIPSKFTCKGKDVNPSLIIKDIPKKAKSLALIMDDPDAPAGTFVHWVVFNIPIISQIKENSSPGTLVENDFKKKEYGGPCPPSGIHRYFFKLYALDVMLKLKENPSKEDIEIAMVGHILEEAVLIGLVEKE